MPPTKVGVRSPTSSGRRRDRASWLRLVATAGREAVRRLFKSEDFVYASAIAYYALISLFHFLMFAASVLRRVTDSEAERQAVGDLILQFFPEQVDLVSDQLERVASAGVGFEIVATLVIAWAALGVFRVISRAVNYAWDLEDPPGLLRNHLMAFAMLLASGLLLVAALGWVSVVGLVRSSWFAELIEVVPGLDGPGVFTTRWPATVALVVVVGLIHFFVPAAKVRLRDVWLGAVITGLLWQMALNGFSWYLAEVANFSVHGSIATAVTFLVWVYASAVIFLFGVEFSAAWVRLQGASRTRL